MHTVFTLMDTYFYLLQIYLPRDKAVAFNKRRQFVGEYQIDNAVPCPTLYLLPSHHFFRHPIPPQITDTAA
jgi:hypothetical protein